MRIERAAGSLGAYVRDLRVTDALDSHRCFEELEATLFDYGVLFLRAQELSPLQLQELATRFGDIAPHGAYPLAEGSEHVQVLASTEEKPSKIEVWHTDMTFRASPPAITLLHAQSVPAYGGDTLWSSTSTAFEALSQATQSLLSTLEARHDFRHGFKESIAEAGDDLKMVELIRANPPVTHPVVGKHPRTGRLLLYVNRLFTEAIVGMSARESHALLEMLFQHIRREEFTVRLRWRAQTLAIWDNRLTQHKPINDYFPQRRLMHRVTVAGAAPLALDRASRTGSEPTLDLASHVDNAADQNRRA